MPSRGHDYDVIYSPASGSGYYYEGTLSRLPQEGELIHLPPRRGEPVTVKVAAPLEYLVEEDVYIIPVIKEDRHLIEAEYHYLHPASFKRWWVEVAREHLPSGVPYNNKPMYAFDSFYEFRRSVRSGDIMTLRGVGPKAYVAFFDLLEEIGSLSKWSRFEDAEAKYRDLNS